MTAVAVYLAMTRRAPLLLALTSLGLFAELGVSLWDLAAREHIVAIAAGVACAAVTTARRRSRRARTPGAEHALADAAFSPW
jgi:hypothetical protein